MQENQYTRIPDKGPVIEMSKKIQDILIRNWLFNVLPGRVLSDLSYQFIPRSFSKNQYVFHQNDEANSLYVIIEGVVSIETISLDGKITKISVLGEGDIFGEFALLDRKSRSANAIVTKKTILASLNRSIFFNLIESYPSFSKVLMEILVGRLRGSNQQVESLVTMSLLQRTAQHLIYLSQRSGSPIQITQNELALRLHATREKVNSKLKYLERLGAITTGHGKIKINNLTKLANAVELVDN